MPAVTLAPIGNWLSNLATTGLPLNGGKLFTYAAGTTTPQATYTSSSGTVANTNPIILGADGRVTSPIWLDNTLSYKFVLQDSLGVTIPNGTYDNIVGINSLIPIANGGTGQTTAAAALAALGGVATTDLANTSNVALGDALVGVHRTLTNATANTLHQVIEGFVVSAFDFMTAAQISDVLAGTHLQDVTTALNNAVSAVHALGSGTVYLPAGSYRVSSTITLFANIRILGAGSASTIILPFANGFTVFSMVQGAQTDTQVEVCDLKIQCQTGSASNIQGIQYTFCNHTKIQNIEFAGCKLNYDINKGYGHIIKNVLSTPTASFSAGACSIRSDDDTKYVGYVDMSGYFMHNQGTGAYGTGGAQTANLYIRRCISSQFEHVNMLDLRTGSPASIYGVIVENDCQGLNIHDSQIIAAGVIGIAFQRGAGVAVDPTFCKVVDVDVDQCTAGAIAIANGQRLFISGGNITASSTGTTTSGIALNGGSLNQISGVMIDGWSGVNGAGVLFGSGVQDCAVKDCKINNCYLGVFLTGTNNNAKLINNELTNVANAGSGIGGSVSAPGVLIDNCPGTLVNGSRAPGSSPGGDVTPAVPATGVGLANTTGYKVRVWITGGTVTVVAINAVTTGQVAGMFELYPGETIAVTYSAVPTWKWLGM